MYSNSTDVLSAPVAALAVANATALKMTWMEPYSHPDFPVLTYTLTVHNTMEATSSVSIQYNATVDSREYLLTTESAHIGCQNVTFEVIANNSIGPSEAGVVTGGFPISECSLLFCMFLFSSLTQKSVIIMYTCS